ncbi:uncharacterized protein LOC126394486 isoform X2 [Epinephelus moara]|uniref:uncharacterized protein LOC126394486 isoform X2 n=1 Tax=Epinephelus moara TaxID=300413 RepID=UPI00214E3FD8|nr:uncharacterized protein LOC126394486 isoform X2 [Epinephelus moara]
MRQGRVGATISSTVTESVIQKSAPISNMDELYRATIFIFLLLRAAELIQCFPVTASQGGNQSVQVFFCKDPGCAANVTHIFCSDKSVNFSHTHITECSGPPPPNNVCQHDGRAFVSKDTAGSCDFEDQNNICAFISATTPSPVTTEGTPKDHAKHEHTVGGVVGGLLLLIALACVIVYYFIRRNKNKNNRQQGTLV